MHLMNGIKKQKHNKKQKEKEKTLQDMTTFAYRGKN